MSSQVTTFNKQAFANQFSYASYLEMSAFSGMAVSAFILGTQSLSYSSLILLCLFLMFPLAYVLIRKRLLSYGKDKSITLFELNRGYSEIVVEFLMKIGVGIIIIAVIRGFAFGDFSGKILTIMLLIGVFIYFVSKFCLSKLAKNERNISQKKNERKISRK